MNDIDDKESLELFADQVKDDIYYDFYDDLSNHVLDKKRKELMMDFLARAYAYSKQYKYLDGRNICFQKIKRVYQKIFVMK